MARNKRDIPSIVSGAGLTAAFWTMVGEEGRKRGLLEEEYHQLGTSEGREFAIKLVESIIAARPGAKSKPAIVLSTEVTALVPRGWTVEEDVPMSDFRVEDLEFISFLENGESKVGGEAMRKHAVMLEGNFGLADAPRFLANQAAIPAEMRGKYIVLPGTVLRGSGGSRHVPYLDWGGGQWVLGFGWLGGDWNDRVRVARCK